MNTGSITKLLFELYWGKMAYMSNVPKKICSQVREHEKLLPHQTMESYNTETSSQQMKYNILNQWSIFLALGVQLNVTGISMTLELMPLEARLGLHGRISAGTQVTAAMAAHADQPRRFCSREGARPSLPSPATFRTRSDSNA